MADPKFFDNKGPFSLAELAEKTGCEIVGDTSLSVNDVAPLDQAGPEQISFLDNIKYKDQFLGTKAGACFVSPAMQDFAPDGCALLVSKQPYKAYALAAQAFYPEDKPQAHISELAMIAKSAEIGDSCTIEPGAVIHDGAKIGAQCWIESGAVIGRNVEIGDHSRVGSNATLSHCILGQHVRIYPGACIGQDGFGFAIDPAGHVKVPQLGRVMIHDGVQIGANTTVDRGAGPDTVIGQGTWIDNLVQIGHNAKVGMGCIIVAQAGVSGSTELGDFVAMGGQVGIAGHLKIGSGARIAAQSGVMKDIGPGEEHMGYPAMPLKSFMKQTAMLKRMLKKDKKVS